MHNHTVLSANGMSKRSAVKIIGDCALYGLQIVHSPYQKERMMKLPKNLSDSVNSQICWDSVTHNSTCTP